MEKNSIGLLKKLQFKDGMKSVFFQLPENLDNNLQELGFPTCSASNLTGNDIDFFLAFVQDRIEIESAAEKYLPLLRPDALLWFCYPKKSSGLRSAGISRDHGWDYLLQKDFLPVRIISVDDNWSALRFRHRSLISKITRKF
jgi:hypothetical protein